MSVIPKHAFKAEEMIRHGRTTQAKVDEIKKWLLSKRNIPPMSDEQIVLFLMACKNVVENTQVTIENYFKIKSSAPELFAKRDVDSKDLKQAYSCAYTTLMPARTKNNDAVVIGALKDTSYYNFHLDTQVKALLMLPEIMLYSEPPSGVIFVVSLKGVGIMHLTRLKLGTIKKFLTYVQEALPSQLKAVHVLHATYIFEKILFILKPFMKKELFDMIIPHPVEMEMNEFFEKYIPASCIPVDFGGNLPGLQEISDEMFKEIRRLTSFLDMDEKQVQLYKN